MLACAYGEREKEREGAAAASYGWAQQLTVLTIAWINMYVAGCGEIVRSSAHHIYTTDIDLKAFSSSSSPVSSLSPSYVF